MLLACIQYIGNMDKNGFLVFLHSGATQEKQNSRSGAGTLIKKLPPTGQPLIYLDIVSKLIKRKLDAPVLLTALRSFIGSNWLCFSITGGFNP